MVLEAIYEQDYLPCSYGFRPGRSAHQALNSLDQEIWTKRLYWVLELDIYPVHVITRKSLGEMTRKLSVTESHSPTQFLGTVWRRNPRVASANSRHVA